MDKKKSGDEHQPKKANYGQNRTFATLKVASLREAAEKDAEAKKAAAASAPESATEAAPSPEPAKTAEQIAAKKAKKAARKIKEAKSKMEAAAKQAGDMQKLMQQLMQLMAQNTQTPNIEAQIAQLQSEIKAMREDLAKVAADKAAAAKKEEAAPKDTYFESNAPQARAASSQPPAFRNLQGIAGYLQMLHNAGSHEHIWLDHEDPHKGAEIWSRRTEKQEPRKLITLTPERVTVHSHDGDTLTHAITLAAQQFDGNLKLSGVSPETVRLYAAKIRKMLADPDTQLFDHQGQRLTSIVLNGVTIDAPQPAAAPTATAQTTPIRARPSMQP